MSVVCSITREVDVYVAMARTREIAQQLGFDQIDRTRIEIAVLELSRNILVHAGAGKIQIDTIDSSEAFGIVINACDHGPGIADIELAMRDGFSTAQTLGAGLPGVRRLMDTFSIESTVGVGTCVRATKWLKSARSTHARGKRT
jgi:anti-sigma regulatory factor (Ser/Thr protein kinase)